VNEKEVRKKKKGWSEIKYRCKDDIKVRESSNVDVQIKPKAKTKSKSKSKGKPKCK
jgi:hypothetical protein